MKLKELFKEIVQAAWEIKDMQECSLLIQREMADDAKAMQQVWAAEALRRMEMEGAADARSKEMQQAFMAAHAFNTEAAERQRAEWAKADAMEKNIQERRDAFEASKSQGHRGAAPYGTIIDHQEV